MGDDGVLAIDDSGIIAALVEHAHVNSEHIGEIDGTGHGSLIRGDNHQVVI